MRLLFLGDLHGHFSVIHQYIDLYDIKDAYIIQVGDFGVGFTTLEKEKRMLEMFHAKLVKANVFVWAIRGNHDFKPYFDNDPFELTNIKLVPDYTVLNLEGNNILCIGGAVSVDRMFRKTLMQKKGDLTIYGHETWWPDETFVLDRDKLGAFRDINIVVTHTAPAFCFPDNSFGFGPFIDNIVLKTGDDELKTDLLIERQQVSDAFTILKMNNDIDLHLYGHFHDSRVENLYGTSHRLLGVGELWEPR